MQSPGWQQPTEPEQNEDGGAQIGSPARDGAPAEGGRRSALVNGRYEDFLRSTVDWLWQTDAGLSLTFVSSPVALKLGIPAQVLVGRPLLGLGRFAKDGAPEQRAEAAIEARRAFRRALYVMTGAQDREVAYHLSGVPTFDEDSGRFAGYRGTAVAVAPEPDRAARDDEELRALAVALEDVLLRYQDLSWRASRAVAAGKTEHSPLARTAHELRTPLNAIVGYADLALKEVFGPLGERYLDCFRTIHEAGHHLDQLVAQLQDAGTAAGAEPLASEIVEVAGVVAKAKAIVVLSAQAADVDISRVGAMAGGRVVGDRVACTQILVNLLGNAVKFTPAGGSVGLETLGGAENRLQIVVWDTGIGIPEDEQARIFESSYRSNHGGAPDQVPGLGLGLAISRDLARAMGGDITVSSQPGQGSRFILALPLAAEPVPNEV